MDHYRKRYRKLVESNPPHTHQTSDGSSTAPMEFKSEPLQYAAVSKDFPAEQKLALGQHAHLTYDMDSDVDDEDEEDDMEPSIRDSFESITLARNSADKFRIKLEKDASALSTNDSSEEDQWWLNHEEDDLVYASPLSYSHEFLLPGSPHHFVTVDEPRDILAIDHFYDQFLDIRDKDFFNVTSGIPEVSHPTVVPYNHVMAPLLAHVDVPRSDDLYSWGIDGDFI